MYRTFPVLLLFMTALIFTSCGSTQKIEMTRTTSIYGPGVMQKPVLVDLEVEEAKVTGQANGRTSRLAEVKNAALSDALQRAKADVLVEPIYASDVQRGKVTVTVSGYPAVYKNFRPVESSDIPLLETGILQQAAVSEAAVGPEKKKGVAAIIAGVVVVLAAVIFLVS